QYKGTPHETSTQVHMTTRFGAERAIRYAFDLTRKRNDMRQLHLVAKTNVLTFVHDTWWRAFNEVGEADYPDIKREYAHVDSTTSAKKRPPPASKPPSSRRWKAARSARCRRGRWGWGHRRWGTW